MHCSHGARLCNAQRTTTAGAGRAEDDNGSDSANGSLPCGKLSRPWKTARSDGARSTRQTSRNRCNTASGSQVAGQRKRNGYPVIWRNPNPDTDKEQELRLLRRLTSRHPSRVAARPHRRLTALRQQHTKHQLGLHCLFIYLLPGTRSRFLINCTTNANRPARCLFVASVPQSKERRKQTKRRQGKSPLETSSCYSPREDGTELRRGQKRGSNEKKWTRSRRGLSTVCGAAVPLCGGCREKVLEDAPPPPTRESHSREVQVAQAPGLVLADERRARRPTRVGGGCRYTSR